MDLQALARHIAIEIIERLQKENVMPCVMVLDHRTPETTAAVGKAVGAGYEIRFMGEATGAQAVEKYLLPRLSCHAMADLALGRASDAQTRAVLDLLLSGLKIEVLEFDYISFQPTCPGPLYSLYESYRKTLDSFGLKEFQANRPNILRLRDDLITEKTVLEAHGNGISHLVALQKSIITPAAREAASELDISIEIER